MTPEVHYAKCGEVHIAYMVFGVVDLIWMPGFISHVEHWWDEPSQVRLYQRLGRFDCLVIFDKRGTGLSDRCRALVLYGAFARFRSWFPSDEALQAFFAYVEDRWGSGASLPGSRRAR